MYDISSIQHWIETSGITCDDDFSLAETETGRSVKGSKRPYPTPDPEVTASALKRRRIGKKETGTGTDTDVEFEDGVTEATPRAVPQGRPSCPGPPLVAPPFAFNAPPDTASPRSSAASSSHTSASSIGSSSASGTKRSRKSALSSPSKRAMLRAIHESIKIHAFTDSAVHSSAPLGFRDLVDRILDFAEGLNTVPACLESELEGKSERSFNRRDVYYNTPDHRSPLGAAPTLAEVDRVVKQAHDLREDGDSEAAYNSLLHRPLFALAHSLSPHCDSVAVKNIVHASISPASLHPLNTDNEPIRSNKVDWVVVLRPTGNLDGALSHIKRQPDDGQLSFNQTRYVPLIDKPIAVSVETKSEAEDVQQAYTQLAVWSSAQMTRLRQLLTDSAAATPTLPFLPLLIAQGPVWSFCFASHNPKDDSTHFWARVDFGDASTRHGVFKVISVLLLLIDWSETQYRPWFEQNALIKR